MNCLVTKLKGVVNDPELLKLGEVKIYFPEAATIMYFECNVDGVHMVAENGQIGVGLSPSSYVTEHTVNTSAGEKYFQLQMQAGSYLSLTPKYELTKLLFRNAESVRLVGGDEQLKTMSKLDDVTIDLSDGEMIASYIANIPNLRRIQGRYNNQKVYCRIADGDVFKGANNLEYIDCGGVGINKNWNTIFALPKLEKITWVSADTIGTDYRQIHWESTTLRQSSYPILLFERYGSNTVFFKSSTDLDNYLINMASCQETVEKGTIFANTERTSASDAAVSTLEEKGYTVSISKSE